jgi:hypothetical protein
MEKVKDFDKWFKFFLKVIDYVKLKYIVWYIEKQTYKSVSVYINMSVCLSMYIKTPSGYIY